MRTKATIILAIILMTSGIVAAAVTASLADADALWIGEARNDFAGSSLAVVGDVNGDGYDDFAIGAQSNDTAARDAGAVYLIYGGTSFATQSVTETIAFTGRASEYAGGSIAGVGDVNNDSYDDFVIGATGNDGRAYLVLGQGAALAGGDLSSVAIEYAGQSGDFAGGEVAGAGDVNGDGYDDFLVSAAGSSADAQFGGAAYLILGSATPSGGNLNAHLQFTGGDDYMNLGSVAGVGDVNNDGYDDLMLGAAGYGNSYGDYAGAGWLILGAATLSDGDVDLLTAAGHAHRFDGTAEYRGLGIVRAAGDLNNDGYADALMMNNDGEAPFSVYVLPGSANPAGYPLDLAIEWRGSDTLWLNAPVSVGDLNEDNYDDVLIPSSGYDGGKGAAFVMLGSGTFADQTIDTLDYYEGVEGISALAAGDVNNDGSADLLFGASAHSPAVTMQFAGAAYLMLSGSSSTPTAVGLVGQSADSTPIITLLSLTLIILTTCSVVASARRFRFAIGVRRD